MMPSAMRGGDEQGGERWRFKREVSTGDVLLALSILIPGLWFMARLEGRVTAVEDNQKTTAAAQVRVDAAQDQAMRESVYRVEGAVRDIQSFLLNNASVLRAPPAPVMPAPSRPATQ